MGQHKAPALGCVPEARKRRDSERGQKMGPGLVMIRDGEGPKVRVHIHLANDGPDVQNDGAGAGAGADDADDDENGNGDDGGDGPVLPLPHSLKYSGFGNVFDNDGVGEAGHDRRQAADNDGR